MQLIYYLYDEKKNQIKNIKYEIKNTGINAWKQLIHSLCNMSLMA